MLTVDSENPTGATRLYERAGMAVELAWEHWEKELHPAKRMRLRVLPGRSPRCASCNRIAETYERRAMASISTRPPFGRAPTANVERAGGGSGMCLA